MQCPYGCPVAQAHLQGGRAAPCLRGWVRFYQRGCGILVSVSVSGLPEDGFHGFHIHEGSNCGGDNFSDTMGHYDPGNALHPAHAGDLPPLLSCSGRAYMTIWTNRFCIQDVIGRTVIVHSGSDDFKTQPSGDSGEKIGCGVIRKL